MMPYYNICPLCQSANDPGEICDCVRQQSEDKKQEDAAMAEPKEETP